jgi:hypothetical protein
MQFYNQNKNMDIDKSWMETDLYKNAKLKTYTSISAVSAATGIPKVILKMAKKQNVDGFNTNSTISLSRLKAALPKFIETLEGKDVDDLEDISYWKKEIAKNDAKLKELQIQKLEKDLIEPDDVRRLLIDIATVQSVVLNSSFAELPPKISGKSEADCKIILDETLKKIYGILADKISSYE